MRYSENLCNYSLNHRNKINPLQDMLEKGPFENIIDIEFPKPNLQNNSELTRISLPLVINIPIQT